MSDDGDTREAREAVRQREEGTPLQGPWSRTGPAELALKQQGWTSAPSLTSLWRSVVTLGKRILSH